MANVLACRVLDNMTNPATADLGCAEELVQRALAASRCTPIPHYAKGNLLWSTDMRSPFPNIGADTFPQNFIEELRTAAIQARIPAGQARAVTAADIFTAATLGGARPRRSRAERPGRHGRKFIWLRCCIFWTVNLSSQHLISFAILRILLSQIDYDPGSGAEAGPPSLGDRFLMPRDFVWGTFPTRDGAKLRWGHLPVTQPRAHFVLVSGFGDFIEKQFETVRDMAALGFAVWCLDWRGQGGSTRPTRWPNRPRARRFERDGEELAAFTRRYLPQDQPRVLLAHSMGGAIALLCLHRDPGLFDAVVLSAPMFGLVIGQAPRALRLVTLPARYSILGLCRLPGSRRWHPTEPPTPDRSLITSDPERCRLRHAWVTADPRLGLHQPTFAWLDPTLALLTRIHRPQFLAQIRTPILLGSPGREYVVARSAHRRIAHHLPDCTFVELPDSKHEAALEADSIREGWLARIDRFVAERIEGRAVKFAESTVTVDVPIGEARRGKRGPLWAALSHYLGGTSVGRLLHEAHRLGSRFGRWQLGQGRKRLPPTRTGARSR